MASRPRLEQQKKEGREPRISARKRRVPGKSCGQTKTRFHCYRPRSATIARDEGQKDGGSRSHKTQTALAHTSNETRNKAAPQNNSRTGPRVDMQDGIAGLAGLHPVLLPSCRHTWRTQSKQNGWSHPLRSPYRAPRLRGRSKQIPHSSDAAAAPSAAGPNATIGGPTRLPRANSRSPSPRPSPSPPATAPAVRASRPSSASPVPPKPCSVTPGGCSRRHHAPYRQEPIR